MAWPTEQEEQIQLLLTALEMAPRGFFLLQYRDSGTRIALYARLKREFASRNWRFYQATPSPESQQRLADRIADALAKLPADVILIPLEPELEGDTVRFFKSLNLQREALYDLETPILFLISHELHPRFLQTAHDLSTWIAPAYAFALPGPNVPDLPPPSRDVPQDLAEQIDYYRDLVQERLEQDEVEWTCDYLLPNLADTYKRAGMYDIARQIYHCLSEYHALQFNDKQCDLFERLDRIVQGWQIFPKLMLGDLSSQDSTVLRELFGQGVFSFKKTAKGVRVTDEGGWTVNFPASMHPLLIALLTPSASKPPPPPAHFIGREIAAIVAVFAVLVSFILYIVLQNPNICIPGKWCSPNSQVLREKTVFALAGCEDGTLFAGAEDGIYRRAPGDAGWEQEGLTDGYVRGLVASPNCKLVYAVVEDSGILRRDNNGSWPPVSGPGDTVTIALLGDRVLVGRRSGVLYAEVDKLDSWIEPSSSFTGTVVSLVRSDGQVYAAVWGRGVWYCDENDLNQWQIAKGGNEIKYALQASGPLTNGAPRFVGVDDGFYRWNGTRWEKGPRAEGNTRTFCFAIDGATVYAGQENNGVLRSTDGGETWEQINFGWQTPDQVRTLLIRIDENGRRWLYAGTTQGVWRYLLPGLRATPTPRPTATPAVVPTTVQPTGTALSPPPTSTPAPSLTPTNTPWPPTLTSTPVLMKPTSTYRPTNTPAPSVVLVGPEDGAKFSPGQRISFHWIGPEPETGGYYEVRLDRQSLGQAWFNSALQQWEQAWISEQGDHTWQVILMAPDKRTVRWSGPVRTLYEELAGPLPTLSPP